MAYTETVAVLGAGETMGLLMARNIARAGIPVRAWDRARDKTAPLAEDGAYIADSPADAARGAGIVLTILADEDAVLAVMDGEEGALSAMAWAPGTGTDDPYGPAHAVWVQMGTVGEAVTRRCAGLANQRGVGLLHGRTSIQNRPVSFSCGQIYKVKNLSVTFDATITILVDPENC